MEACLVALPGQPAAQQEDEGVGERFQVVPSARSPPKVRMHAGISYSSPATTQHFAQHQSIQKPQLHKTLTKTYIHSPFTNKKSPL